MLAMALKELRQLARDRRTVAMMVVLPVVLLVIFGYAARFDIDKVPTHVAGSAAQTVKAQLPSRLDVVAIHADWGREESIDALRRAQATVVVIADPKHPAILVDGANLFGAQSVLRALAGQPSLPKPEVLFNPALATSVVMVPGLMGMILVFIGTVATSLGVVRERQSGTLEQLAVMPFRPRDVFLGKILPYFGVAIVDLVIVVLAGLWIFGVPFNGSPWIFAIGAVLFLFVALGMGVLISTVSENQGQAIQLAIMTLLPQILLSGLIFPLDSVAVGVRWIGYLLPLTYFVQIARGVMVRAAPFDALLVPMGMLLLLGVVVFGLSVLRFSRDLAPAGSGGSHGPSPARQPEAAA
ncbi:MAG: ABC transporter permease [Chloroflexota bacterium]|nr:ABC transporter permease [Chloroflexota bacterium]